MSAYAIFEMKTLHDAQLMDQYRAKARPTLVAHGAKPLVLRGEQKVLEGDAIDCVVVLEFESYEKALTWYNSPEYQECKKLREKAADINTVIVKGI